KGLIIIPCFNEASSIPNLIAEIKEVQKELLNLDILIVNDCSSDNTVEIIKKMQVKLLDLPVNLGIGGAVQSGFLYAYLND
ncbi:glycosyltransferase family 2 protein, partial [Acinetobacter baumannii]